MTDQNTTPAEAVERVAKATHSYRQRIDPECYADWAEEVDRSDRFPELGYIVTTMDEASAAIQAHTAYLWERGLGEDVVEAVSQYAVEAEGDDWDWICEHYPSVAQATRNVSRGELTAALTALLGPRPEGARDDD